MSRVKLKITLHAKKQKNIAQIWSKLSQLETNPEKTEITELKQY